jgi:hypothetical protein
MVSGSSLEIWEPLRRADADVNARTRQGIRKDTPSVKRASAFHARADATNALKSDLFKIR